MSLTDSKTIVEIVQGVLTIAGIVVAAIWSYLLFIRQRQRFPRAKLEHKLAVERLLPDLLLVRVSVEVVNAGNVLLQLQSAEARLQVILPVDPAILGKIAQEENLIAKNMTEVLWPSLWGREFGFI